MAASAGKRKLEKMETKVETKEVKAKSRSKSVKKKKLSPSDADDEKWTEFLKNLDESKELLPKNSVDRFGNLLNELVKEKGLANQNLTRFLQETRTKYKSNKSMCKFLTVAQKSMQDLQYTSFNFHAKHGSEFYVYAYWYKWNGEQVAWMKIKDNYGSEDSSSFIKKESDNYMTAWFDDELDELIQKWGENKLLIDEETVNEFINNNEDSDIETDDLDGIPQSHWPLVLLQGTM